MHVLTVATTTFPLCLLCVFGEDISNTFGIIAQGSQFKNFGKLMTFKELSLTACAVKCLVYGSECGSFSFTKPKTCSINVLHLPFNGMDNPSGLLDAEDGTRVYARMSGETISLHIMHTILWCPLQIHVEVSIRKRIIHNCKIKANNNFPSSRMLGDVD